MATVDAIAAVTDALRALLERAREPAPAASDGIDVRVVRASDLATLAASSEPIVGVFLHRVAVSTARRGFPARTAPTGEPLRPPLPVDLGYLVVAWASDALTQQRLLGWAARAIEDTPALPATLLNANRVPGAFLPAETVEVVWAPLSEQEEADVWQVAQGARQPAASYVARMVLLESRLALSTHRDVQTRELRGRPTVEVG